MNSSAFKVAFSQVKAYLKREGLLSADAGILCALSGGADSVLLTYVLHMLSKEYGFALEAIHVNHGIRGEDAFADEAFCASFCESLALPLHIERADVPAIANALGKGLEEAARDVRYAAFDRILEQSPHLNHIAVAHNSTDNLETVLFHMARGCGIAGLCGIPPKRQSIIRPLLAVDKKTVVEALKEQKIGFVVDKTNVDTAYRRNLIRHKVLPPLREINERVEQKATDMCAHLREDMQFLEEAAKAFYAENVCGASISIEKFLNAPKALSRRVAVLLYEAAGGCEMLESVHTDALFASLETDKHTFVHRFPGDVFVYAQKGMLVFSKEPKKAAKVPLRQEIHLGENLLSDRHGILTLTENPDYLKEQSLNVYKIAIKADVSSATMKGSLYVRAREEGDSYRYNSMTHSVKKLFSQKRLKGIPKEEIPILCDDEGIFWVPGFSVRDEEPKKENNRTLFAYYTYFGGENEQGH